MPDSPIRRLSRRHPLTAAARRWLAVFQACVQRVDYAAARPLFARDVCAFGTHAAVVDGRPALERGQWRKVWPNIANFKFRLGEMRCLGDPHGLCVIVPWDSRGLRPDGRTFLRPGRATLLLVPRAGRWVALHSHFSRAPSARTRSVRHVRIRL